MDAVILTLQSLVVLGAIVAGVRTGGVGIGLWGAVGAAVLVFVFGLQLGSPPIDALLIIVAVVVATSTMQACGGTDWLVLVAARVIVRRPRSITVIAPVASLLLAALAGTSNILFSLLPVIEEASRRANIRPVKPLSMSVVATSIALATSPVSAAMAAMVVVMDDAHIGGWNVLKVIAVTMPAALIGVVVTALLVQRFGGPDQVDPTLATGGSIEEVLAPLEERATGRGRAAALVYLVSIVVIILLSLFITLRPVTLEGKPASVAMIIQLVMLATGAVIALIGRPDMDSVPKTSIFQGGMVAAIAFFGLAWMLDTYLKAHTAAVARVLGNSVGHWPWVMTLAVFSVAVLTTSQSTATRMILPIGLAAGLPFGIVTGLWVGALGGIYLLPTNGLQIAAANLDQTGSTRLGTRLYDNSFFVPSLALTLVTTLVGGAIGFAVS